MANITLSGILTIPNGDPAVGDTIRFTHKTTTGNTIKTASTCQDIVIPPDGSYLVIIEYGQILVEYKSCRGAFNNVGLVVVNQDSTATSIPELLNAAVPPTDEQLLEFQSILADTVAAKDIAVAAKDIAVAAAEQFTTTEIIYSPNTYAVDDVIKSSGFTAKGDGGAASWQKTSTTGTPSQTPAQLGDATLTDPSGNVWALIFETNLNIKAIGGDIASGDNSAVFLAAESSALRVDLQGGVYNTSLAPQDKDLSLKYFNGTVNLTNINEVLEPFKSSAVVNDYEISRPRTKTPLLDWEGKNVLWLGTSIPIENEGGGGSYPELFGNALGCNVLNNAWAGSHAFFDYSDDAFSINTVKALSMTETDRLRGLAEFGPTSAYDDSFDIVTKASQMTVDYRVKTPFDSLRYDVVVLDHNHNDRKRESGTLEIQELAINSVSLGANTVITMADASSISVGDSIGLRVEGVESLDYLADSVTAVSGNDVTINVDSSLFVGTFTSGTLTTFAKNTIRGAFNFLIYYTLNTAARAGVDDVKIILCGAPSEHTNDEVFANDIWSSSQIIRGIAEFWDFSFFDIGFLFDVKSHDQLTFFPDGVHPTSLAARKSIANMWTTWARGGAATESNPADFLPTGNEESVNNREAMFSKYDAAFATRSTIFGDDILVGSQDFQSGFGAWTTGGAGAAPTIVAAPWGAGDSALLASVTGANSTLALSPTEVLGDNPSVEFDFQMPVVTGLNPPGASSQASICQIRKGAQAYNIQLLFRESSVSLRFSYFQSPNIDLINFSVIPLTITADTRYRVRVDIVKDTGTGNGAALLYVDDVLLGRYELFNVNQTAMNSVRVGADNITVDAFDIYISNIVYSSKDTTDYTQRHTGDVVTSGGTLNIVNGVIVGVS